MTAEELLIDYFARRRILITQKNAEYLVKMIAEKLSKEYDLVILSRYTAQRKGYETLRELRVRSKETDKIKQKHIRNIPGFYKYSVFDPEGNFKFELETLNPDLF